MATAKTGLRPTPTDAKTTPTTAKKAAPQKRLTPALKVADAVAKGQITLGTALGFKPEEREQVRLQVYSWIRSNKHDKAIPILRGLVALDPYDHWCLLTLATLLLKDLEDADLVGRLLERALTVKRDDPDTLAARAELRHRAGDKDGALADLRTLEALPGGAATAERRSTSKRR
jgi:predicted Zn-dependent protease